MKFQIINFIENITNELLINLHLNKNDLSHINYGLANCKNGFLLYEEDDDIIPFENLIFWIDYSLDLLNCKTKIFKKRKIRYNVDEITISLQKLKSQCPNNLYWKRQFAKKWL